MKIKRSTGKCFAIRSAQLGRAVIETVTPGFSTTTLPRSLTIWGKNVSSSEIPQDQGAV